MSDIHKFYHLELERLDYRKPENNRLTPDQEKERRRLLTQLTSAYPLWALSRQIDEEIDKEPRAGTIFAPVETPSLHVLKQLRDLVLDVSSGPRATNHEEEMRLAESLRGFVVRRDLEGATKWAKQR